MNKSRPELLRNLIIISRKHGAEQKSEKGITNEKVKFLEISTLNTDYYEEKYSQTAVHKCFKV